MGFTIVLDQLGGTYVVWQSWRELISVGTREDARNAVAERYGTIAADQVLKRVDQYGTSIPAPGDQSNPQFGWADPRISSDQLWPDGPNGWLPRERLVAFARALLAGDDEAAAALLDPAEPDAADTDASKDLT